MKSILTSALMGIVGLWLALSWEASHAREQYPGQYKDVPKDVQDWFRSQRNPKNGAQCCNEADGVYAEEDIRHDRYWVRFNPCPNGTSCARTDWMPVPPDSVIYDPNRNGAPVVWWYIANSQYQIRCYAPGVGI
jgi:hypothetical protein